MTSLLPCHPWVHPFSSLFVLTLWLKNHFIELPQGLHHVCALFVFIFWLTLDCSLCKVLLFWFKLQENLPSKCIFWNFHFQVFFLFILIFFGDWGVRGVWSMASNPLRESLLWSPLCLLWRNLRLSENFLPLVNKNFPWLLACFYFPQPSIKTSHFLSNQILQGTSSIVDETDSLYHDEVCLFWANCGIPVQKCCTQTKVSGFSYVWMCVPFRGQQLCG